MSLCIIINSSVQTPHPLYNRNWGISCDSQLLCTDCSCWITFIYHAPFSLRQNMHIHCVWKNMVSNFFAI